MKNSNNDKRYFLGVLSLVVHQIAVDEEDANKRLAKHVSRACLIPNDVIPNVYRNEFNKLKQLVKKEKTNLPKNMPFVKFYSIRKKKASGYIQLLFNIYSDLKIELENKQ